MNSNSKPTCENCGRGAIRVSYRFTDRVRRYKSSQRKMIHTGYLYLCMNHAKAIEKLVT